MKKIIATIIGGIVFCFLLGPCTVHASSVYPPDVQNALQFEGNITDVGANPATWTPRASPLNYSSTDKCDGSYAISPASGHSIYSLQIWAIKTFDFFIYAPTGIGNNSNAVFLYDNSNSSSFICMNQSGTLSIGDDAHGYLTGITYTKDACHEIQIDYTGTTMNVYLDSVFQGSLADIAPPTNFYMEVGYGDGIGNDWSGQIDDFTESNILYNGSPVATCTGAAPSSTLTPTLTPTNTLASYQKTQTALASESPTPTPSYVITPCPTNPFPAVFTQNPTPMIVPTTDAEGSFVGEPNVFDTGIEGSTRFHMVASINAFFHDRAGNPNEYEEVIELFTAPRAYGPWTRYGIVVGDGVAGVDGQCDMASQIKIGAQYRIYCSSAVHNGIIYCTSADGFSYTYGGVAITSGDFLNTGCQHSLGLDGMGVVLNGANYWAIAEVGMGDCPYLGVSYALWLCKSTNGGNTFLPASPDPLNCLNPYYPAQGLFASGRSTVKIGSRWHTWQHVDYPTNIYHGESLDLYNWITDGVVVGYTQFLWGELNCNQVADTSIVEDQGNTYLYYDAADNTIGDPINGVIGYSMYHGTLAEFDNCELPTMTFTPTLTHTITPTATKTSTSSPTYTATGTKTPAVIYYEIRSVKTPVARNVWKPKYINYYQYLTSRIDWINYDSTYAISYCQVKTSNMAAMDNTITAYSPGYWTELYRSVYPYVITRSPPP
jgi:hypothetical protein